MTLEEALEASEIEPVNDIFLINPETRTITVPETEKIFGVANDGNSERKHFRCQKVVGDNIDLSTMHLYINYQNANGNKYPYLVEDVDVDGDYITFSWLIGPDVVEYKGQIKFIVCAKKGDGAIPEWNTTLAEGTVLEGLEATDEVTERNPDIIEQMLTLLENVSDEPTFVEATKRENVTTGDKVPILWGKVKKWFADLGTAAFCKVVNNLTTAVEGGVLDARQGKALNDALASLNELMGNTDISAIGKGTITSAINELNSKQLLLHNIPRITPKDITSYYNDGSLWKRLSGSSGYTLYQDIYVGDYIKMSRPISAKNPDSNYQLNGSQYVTIASINGLLRNGSTDFNTNHLVMVPGKGFDGTQHFGRSRMNPTNTTVGGYKSSEMNTTVIGAVVTSGSTSADATINQQLYAEFGTHLATTKELVSNGINASGYNRYGASSGCSNNWEWIDAQAILMSEVEIYGSTTWSSSGYDTGNANHQFELFANSQSAINNRSAWYWLKDVASGTNFCGSFNGGDSDHSSASGAHGYVRPRFVIKA